MNPLISVIIPVWNRKKRIIRAVESVLKQSYNNFEIIIADDSSTDGTIEVLEELAKKDARIKLVKGSGKNSGLPAIMRNRAIKKSSGDYLAFLDSDDTWANNKLELQINEISKNTELVGICSNAFIVGETDKAQGLLLKDVPSEITFENLVNVNNVICSSMLVKKTIFEKTGLFPEMKSLRAGEDYASWLKLVNLGKVKYLNDPLLYYTIDSSDSVRERYSFFNESKKMKSVYRNVLSWCKKSGHKKDKIKILKGVLLDPFIIHIFKRLFT